MAPHPRPTGVLSMGGIFNNLNSSSSPINSTHPYPVPGAFNGLPGGAFWARDLVARSKDGGVSGALILAIVIPTFFVIFGLVAILWQAVKVRKLAKARRAARRAARGGRSRSGRSGRSRSGRSQTTGGTTGGSRSYGNFDEIPLSGPSPVYMGSSRRSDRSASSDDDLSAVPLASPRSSLHDSPFFRASERIVRRSQ